MLPWQIKNAIWQTLAIPNRLRVRRRRQAIQLAPGAAPIVSFGGVLDQSFIHGGAVKLLTLRDGFAHDEIRFNLLYLVSSALPEFAEDLVALCRSRGIRFVWNQNGVAYPAWAGPESERYNAPMRRLRRLADFIVYQSDFCRVSADQFLGKVDGPHTTLFNPVALDQFQPGSELPASPLRLLAAGTHSYRERVTSVLECLEELRRRGIDATLTLAGKMEWPNADSEIAAWIERHHLPVQIVPPFSQAEAVQLYQTHHVLIHPKYLDPCPTVVVEALACGLPVVGSSSGGMTEMVPADCGKLIGVPLEWSRMHTPTGPQLAEAVQSLMPELPATRERARVHALNAFDRDQWIAGHRQIFEDLLRG